MRMLTEQELTLVAGGNDSSDAYDNDGTGGNWYGYGTYGGGGGGGGGGYWYWTFVAGTPVHGDEHLAVITANSGYWTYQPFPTQDNSGQASDHITGVGGSMTDFADELQHECQVDADVDLAAGQVANLIKEQPDWNEREYAAIIWMTPDGDIHTSNLIRGQTVAEATALGLTAPETRLTLPDLGGGIILAVIHSHPDIGYDAAGDLENHYPSDRPTDGDYTAFEGLVDHNSAFANNAAFAQYILGPDGVLREFNFKDGRINATNDTDPASRSNLAKDRPCIPG